MCSEQCKKINKQQQKAKKQKQKTGSMKPVIHALTVVLLERKMQ